MKEWSGWYKDARKRYKIGREQPQFWHFSEQGFGYIQIPKVATRSIRKALLAVDDEQSDNRSFAEFENYYSAHISQTRIRRQVTNGLFVFAFVRDPLARLYSAWANKIVDGEKFGRRNIFQCHGMHYGMSFSDFVVRVSQLKDHQLDRHIRSQSWFLSDKEGVLPSYIGRLETFSECWQELCLKIPSLADVDHMNRSEGSKDHMDFYDKKTLSLAVQRFQNDFELFGYELP